MAAQPLRLGSLFTGYAGLDLAVADVLDAQLEWVADNATGPAQILAHRYPQVRNIGDVRSIVFQDQDHVNRPPAESEATPIDVLTCGFPCQDVSDAGRRSGNAGQRTRLYEYAIRTIEALRPALVVAENVRGILYGKGRSADRTAFGDVLADLSAIGYDARWHASPAASVGAPHLRTRVYVLAYPAATDARSQALDLRSRLRQSATPQQRRRRPLYDARTCDQQPAPYEQPRSSTWGAYEPAIRRWERILGRAAPYPVTDTGRQGFKLTPVFVEWLMGLPHGYVTAVPDLTRAEALRALGNGVVPQHGSHVLRALLNGLPHTR